MAKMSDLVSGLLRLTRPNGMLLLIGMASICLSFFFFFHDSFGPRHYDTTVMIVGDSISQGLDGDFTWRYRLWDWLDSNRVSVKFVGPYTGTQERSVDYAATVGSEVTIFEGGGYSKKIGFRSRFHKSGRKHFSAWGRQIQQDVPVIRDLVARYQPDHLLVELGFNDMAWSSSTPFEMLQNMAALIENARAAKPDLTFAIANVPHRYRMKGFEGLVATTDNYNMALPGMLEHLSTHESPVYLVEFRENYWCSPDLCPAAYDGLHPNNLGEFQLAKAFADTIKKGFGWEVNEFVIPETVFVEVRAPYEAMNETAKANK